MTKGKRRVMSSDALRVEIKALTSKNDSRFELTQKELSEELSFSPAYLNRWLSATLSSDTRIEALLESWLLARRLSFRDQRKVKYISSLLANADNKSAVLSAIEIWAESALSQQEENYDSLRDR